eukprot:CAMPEP_0114587936 /NCGR_PEP_ID=MMETSP0125-20121206/10768_1 /TAXON_ID=485358 ORGANISM="Aristerostoma sp., Strain ATCC 50986" /NCGR_SAMPLE_ID=MMETSP0125 /ASSEMBLY_ACC=CAM_ASM_000245 /LENGTH=42 /DNA_ID= /DNA_START= /DNA_END= /DNA_ORIENTATION=
MNNMNAMQAQQGWGQPMGGMQGGMQGGQMNMQAGGQMPNNNI